MHWISLSVLHRKPGGDTILSPDLISENWTPSTLTHTALIQYSRYAQEHGTHADCQKSKKGVEYQYKPFYMTLISAKADNYAIPLCAGPITLKDLQLLQLEPVHISCLELLRSVDKNKTKIFFLQGE